VWLSTAGARSQMPVMIAVDDWNALYWRTAYHEWLNNKHRKRVEADDVRLVAALRGIMEGPPPPPSDDGVEPCLRLLAATSRGSSISESLRVPRPQSSLRTVRMSWTASTVALRFRHARAVQLSARDVTCLAIRRASTPVDTQM